MYRWVIAVVITLAHCIWGIVVSCVGPLSPFLIEDLNLSASQVGLLVSGLFTGYAIMLIPAGLLSDLVGVKPLLTAGVFCLAITIYGVSQFTSFIAQFSLFLLAGLAGGLTMPSATKSIMYWFKAEGRATAMGIKQSGVNLGGMVAGLLLPVLALRFSWRASLELVAVAGLVSGLVTLMLFKDSSEEKNGVMASRRVRFTDSLALLKNPTLLLMSFIDFLLLLVQFTFATYFVLYSTRELGMSVVLAGQYLFLSFACGILGRVGLGALSDYALEGKRTSILIIMALVVSALCATLGHMPRHPPAWLPLVVVLLFGLAGMGWNALFMTTVGEIAGKELSGSAVGLVLTIGVVGVILGPPTFGHILDRGGSFCQGWDFLASCAALAFVLLAFLRKRLKV